MKGQVVEEYPLCNIDHVVVASGGVSLSSDLIEECAERGIPISFITGTGRPYAKLMGAGLVGTVRTRREQLLAYLDDRGVRLAKAFSCGKLLNQVTLLKYMSKYRKDTDVALYRKTREAASAIEGLARAIESLSGDSIDVLRQDILNLEGRAAQAYWNAIADLLIPDLDWKGRETRGAQDVVNSALNYGYGILYCQVERAVVLAGLDPYAGFLHADRSGKPSLVLDLVEEFRQMAVDKAIFGMLNKGMRLSQEDGKLTEDSRRAIAGKVNERLEGEEMYDKRHCKLRTVIQMQARRVAAFVRGEVAYEAWVGRW